jgi:hypothetical protein
MRAPSQPKPKLPGPCPLGSLPIGPLRSLISTTFRKPRKVEQPQVVTVQANNKTKGGPAPANARFAVEERPFQSLP